MNKRYFIITYKEIKKNNFGIIKKSKITIPNPFGNIGYDAKRALDIFINSNGNLKKNTIISIQEVNEEGKNIGEPITPLEETKIVPVKKK